jgi:hypothetical protein
LKLSLPKLSLELSTHTIILGKNFYQRINGSGDGTDLGLFATIFTTENFNFFMVSFLSGDATTRPQARPWPETIHFIENR